MNQNVAEIVSHAYHQCDNLIQDLEVSVAKAKSELDRLTFELEDQKKLREAIRSELIAGGHLTVTTPVQTIGGDDES